MMSFQWFFWLKCVSLRGLRLFSRVAWLGTGQFRWSIGTNGSIGFHPHVREPKTVLDSGLYAMDSGFKVFVSGTWILDSNRHRDSGFLKRYSKAEDSGSKNFPNSGICIPLHGVSFSRMVSGWFQEELSFTWRVFFCGCTTEFVCLFYFILFLIRLCQKLNLGQFNVLY